MRRQLASLSRGNRARSSGQALVEFSLIVLLLIVLFMGIFDLARAAYVLNTVGDAARNGVREAIVNQTCTDIFSRAKSVAPAVDLSAADAVQVTIYIGEVVSNVPTPDRCSSGLGGGYGIGYLAEVKVTTTFAPITPLIGNIVGSIPLTSTARLPIERAYP